MHEVLVNRLGGLSLPRKRVVRLTGRPDMTLDAYRGRKTTMQQPTICNLCKTYNLAGYHGNQIVKNRKKYILYVYFKIRISVTMTNLR